MTLHKRRVFVALVVLVLLLAAAAPPTVRYIGGFIATEDSFVLWGYDIRFYDGRQYGSNETIRLDAGTGRVALAAPTSVATATPIAVFDSDAVSNILEVRDAATPVFTVHDGGRADVTRFQMSAGTSITVTTAVFTPTALYQPIVASGLVTPTIYTASALAGDVHQFTNTGTNNIVFLDGATQALSGNCTLGQYDVLGVLFDGTRWIEQFCTDN